jgi:hypothetical protein
VLGFEAVTSNFRMRPVHVGARVKRVLQFYLVVVLLCGNWLIENLASKFVGNGTTVWIEYVAVLVKSASRDASELSSRIEAGPPNWSRILRRC